MSGCNKKWSVWCCRIVAYKLSFNADYPKCWCWDRMQLWAWQSNESTSVPHRLSLFLSEFMLRCLLLYRVAYKHFQLLKITWNGIH